MGIKFLCPNGHKLHVKSFLSGKRAICPKCGVRVVVPTESTGDSSGDSLTSSTVSVEIDTSLLASQEESVATASQVAPTPAAESVRRTDPIDEAPSAVWYVRPASGGQFGPASGEIMRGWIKDGRVAASSLVWRDGWHEWRSAAATFPQLGSQLAAPGLTTPVANVPLPVAGAQAVSLPQGKVAERLVPSAPPAEVSTSVPPLAEMSRKRRRKKDVSLMASAVLVAVTVILIVILALVFRAQNTPPETESGETRAAERATLDLTSISQRG